jgi:hypothetical protein
MSRDDAAEWSRSRSIAIGDAPDAALSYEGGHPQSFEIEIPRDALRILAFGYILATNGTGDDAGFRGGLLLMRAWDSWSESFERVGAHVVESLRGASMVGRAEAPAQSFEVHEIVDANAFLLQPMLFQWDAYRIPTSGDFFVRMSHHSRANVVVRDRALFESLFERFEQGDWDPHECGAP